MNTNEGNSIVGMYKDFRKELDEMCVPLIINELEIVQPIFFEDKLVGVVAGNFDYIDCLYVQPEYRRKGLATKAVLKYVEGNLGKGIRLHIINNNSAAYKFWNKIFRLRKIESNAVDTLYEIIRIKVEDNR